MFCYRNFCQNLHRKATEMGLTFPTWPDKVNFGRTKDDMEVAFREILAEYKMKNMRCDLILIIMSGKNSDVYS